MIVMTALGELAAQISYLYGHPVTSTAYNDRKKIQKLAYLLNRFGVDTPDYDKMWHHEGPFSFQLHYAYYQNPSDLCAEPVRTPSEKLVRFKQIFASFLEDTNYLELLASVIYLNDEYACHFNEDMLCDLMELKKPKYDRDDVEYAIAFLSSIPEFAASN